MTEEKRTRIMAAASVTTILLIFILAAIVVYQLVVLSAMNGQKKSIQNEIHQLQQETEDKKNTLEDMQSDWWLQQKLLEQGYHY